MNPRVKSVRALPEHRLELLFENGELKKFDVTPYLTKGMFKELNEKDYFKRVKPFMGTVQWPNGQDFCPDTLYECSMQLSTTEQ